MNNAKVPGRLLAGDHKILTASYNEFNAIPVDLDLTDQPTHPPRSEQKTIAQAVSVSGPGTFAGKSTTTITFEPTEREGWWLDRTDQPDSLPIRVAIDNVWTTGSIVSNIVLRAGNPHNYVRMVEHIIALRMGVDVDNLLIKIDAGDPPLFNRGSMDLIDALERAGRRTLPGRIKHVTVKEPVTLCWPHGQFVTLAPHSGTVPKLIVDAAVNFPNAIGQQRIVFPVNYENTHTGAQARTNTPYAKMLYCKTIGKIFADVRNLGYTDKNILIAKKTEYHNQPRLMHKNKSLEAVWHRGVLDLLAAIALIPDARFVGNITSYKAGHRLDCDLVTQLYLNDLLKEI
ncbi:MAG: UDP-3-O-acyl-N-acetylglucosamine deacetylase [Kiritimatiellales bacterium]|nr:UDP-3-O-acyl-N-acetylglucosamine deacetylase [Kiritimatiellota bacterium]MBL7011602.1 UDP-3-O-acyl-N-acetylglucosamine deacetylase [Kiritimatiellales bacterium]